MLNVGDVIRLCPPDLSKSEKEVITRVLYKNLLLLDDHRKQLLPLRTEIHSLKQSSSVVANVDYTKTCMRCRSSIPKCFSAERCVRCKHITCSKCRVSFQHATGSMYWLCCLCARQRSFDVHSGDWINRYFPKTNPMFGNTYSVYPSAAPSSSGSYGSLTSAPNAGSGQLYAGRVKSPVRPAPYYRSEPLLEGAGVVAIGMSDRPSLKSRDKQSMSPIHSTHSSSDHLEKDSELLDTWALTQSVADVNLANRRDLAHPGARGSAAAAMTMTPEERSAYDTVDAKAMSVSQPNLFSESANLRGSTIRRPVRRQTGISAGVGKSMKQASMSNAELSYAVHGNEDEPIMPSREIAVQTRVKSFYDGRAKNGGGWLRLVFEDCALVGSVIDVATSQICQFMACFLPRQNSSIISSKSAQLSRKNDRLDLEIQLPLFTDDTSSLKVHISLWLMKVNFLNAASGTNDGKSHIRRAFLGEAVYTFNELMSLGSGERPLPLYKPLAEFPQVHACGKLTFIVTLFSAEDIRRQQSQQAISKSAGHAQPQQVTHKTATKRKTTCDHLCIQIQKINDFLLPEGIKKFQIYCKTRLLPIKTDHVKTKSFNLGDEVGGLFNYNVLQGGLVKELKWPEPCRQLCVADMSASELAGGRCLELLILNKNRGGLLSGSLAGGSVKTVFGCIRLGSSASFDSTAAEAAIWEKVTANPDVPVTATLPLRPNDGTLLNIIPRLY